MLYGENLRRTFKVLSALPILWPYSKAQTVPIVLAEKSLSLTNFPGNSTNEFKLTKASIVEMNPMKKTIFIFLIILCCCSAKMIRMWFHFSKNCSFYAITIHQKLALLIKYIMKRRASQNHYHYIQILQAENKPALIRYSYHNHIITISYIMKLTWPILFEPYMRSHTTSYIKIKLWCLRHISMSSLVYIGFVTKLIFKGSPIYRQ